METLETILHHIAVHEKIHNSSRWLGLYLYNIQRFLVT